MSQQTTILDSLRYKREVSSSQVHTICLQTIPSE